MSDCHNYYTFAVRVRAIARVIVNFSLFCLNIELVSHGCCAGITKSVFYSFVKLGVI